MIRFNPAESVQRDPGIEVLIDSDCVAYWGAFGCCEQALRTATRRCDIRMNQILDGCKAGKQRGFLTGKNNFRNDIATLQRYKGNRYDKYGKRIKPQPAWLNDCRQYLQDEWGAVVYNGEEADDALSYTRAMFHPEDESVIISTIDKDLRINLGVHHDQNSDKLIKVNAGYKELDVKIKTCPTTGKKKSTKVTGVGITFFYAQLLMGDNADWIKGLPKVTETMKELWPDIRRGGCGEMAAVHVLKGSKDEKEMHERVWLCYKSYWLDHGYQHWRDRSIEFPAGIDTARKQFIEQGRLLWMRQKPGELWEPKFELD